MPEAAGHEEDEVDHATLVRVHDAVLCEVLDDGVLAT
jgi:hypothetical protein